MKKLALDQRAVLSFSLILIILGLAGWVVLREPDGSSNEAAILSRANLLIRVDPTVELFSVIYRLAGINQYTERGLPGMPVTGLSPPSSTSSTTHISIPG